MEIAPKYVYIRTSSGFIFIEMCMRICGRQNELSKTTSCLHNFSFVNDVSKNFKNDTMRLRDSSNIITKYNAASSVHQ